MISDMAAAGHPDEEDQESLFGSLPPSPGRGRSPSPALALPTRGSGTSYATQNVGTIALPGSHMYSELPITPLALSLSLPQASRPPAQGVNAPSMAPNQSYLAPSPTASSVASKSHTSSAATSRASSIAPSQKPKNKKKAKSNESAPRAPGPEITLPDPSAPPPNNFLRNQSALLGTAGVVGGVKPSKLATNRQTRGATPSNPIVIDDNEGDNPSIGRHRFLRSFIPKVAGQLPVPSNQDIVAMLIAQKDIFPVLESILKLIGCAEPSISLQPPTRQVPVYGQIIDMGNTAQSSNATSARSTPAPTSNPPRKKRKLSRVPAGAADWDVPYPFDEGEGPQAYRTTWERERGKQLISQLVHLIKSAAHKAATKNYLQDPVNRKKLEEQQKEHERKLKECARQREAEYSKNVNGYYRPDTLSYGLQGKQARIATQKVAEKNTEVARSSAQTLPSSAPSTAVPANPPSPVSQPAMPTPFDQLISSLIAASGPSGVPAESAPPIVNSKESNQGVDQELYDSWMSVLQTFPVPPEGFSQAQTQNYDGTISPSVASNDFSMFDDNSFFDFDMSDVPEDPTPTKTDFGLIQPLPGGTAVGNSGTLVQEPQGFDEQAIDPSLRSISIPQPLQPSNALNVKPSTSSGANQPLSLSASPAPSMSSFTGHSEPSTPGSAIWAHSPDVYSYASTVNENGSGEGRQGAIGSENSRFEQLENVISDKGKGKEVSQPPVSVLAPAQMLNNSLPPVAVAPAKPSTNPNGSQSPVPVIPGAQFENQNNPQPPASNVPAVCSANTKDTQPASQVASSTSTLSSVATPPTELEPSTDKELLPMDGKAHRDDVLRRAKERKNQLTEELNRTKIRLWETTIEQGRLAHLVKYYNEAGSTSLSFK